MDHSLSYLHNLRQELTPELVQYLFPGLEAIPSAEEMLSAAGRKGISKRVSDICENLHTIKQAYIFRHDYDDYYDLPQTCDAYFDTLEPESEDEELDRRIQEVLDEWSRIEKKYGINIEELEALLAYKVTLSALDITPAGKITLRGFGGKEVKMDNLTKAVYFFFLKNPKGAYLKELQDHEEEILEYYLGLTGRDNMEDIRKSVHNLLDPYGNALNVSISRIKKAFKDILEDRIARYYYVTGKSGRIRKIVLNRDLVNWIR